MKKTKTYQVKIKSITPCGGAFLIEDYNGNNDYFPKSTVFESNNENMVYISAWILEKKEITYSYNKIFWYDRVTNTAMPHICITKYTPNKVQFDPNEVRVDESLIK